MIETNAKDGTQTINTTANYQSTNIVSDKIAATTQTPPQQSYSSSQQVGVNETASQAIAAATASGNNLSKTNYDRSDIKPTKKRYLILFLFCLHSMINAAQWIYLSSITNIVTRYYKVDNMAINWTSMVYMLVYIPLVVPASWLFEKIGMRNSILLGSLGTSLGSFIKCFSCKQDRFYILMFGQTIVAISQLFVLSVPPRLASIWFPDDQVSLANACGVFGNQLGIALGFVVPQLVIRISNVEGGAEESFTNPLESIEDGLFNLFLGITILSTITSSLILFLFDHSPSKPPGMARLQQIKQEIALAESGIMPLVNDDKTTDNNTSSSSSSTYGFGSLLLDLLTDKNFLLLMISYGLNVGVFYAISTVLNQMISPTWNDASKLVGRLGLVMVISGMFGSVISGYLLDKTHMYRFINTSLYTLSFVTMILFTIILQFHNTIALYLIVTMLGYFMTGYLLIGFEMSNEITWPRPESVSAGLLNLSAQVSSFSIYLLYMYIIVKISPFR